MRAARSKGTVENVQNIKRSQQIALGYIRAASH
jgi:hypothetical protein